MKRFYEPTPKWARKLGDSILLASGMITTQAILTNNHTLALIAFWSGVAGKFLTNMFSEEDQSAQSKPQPESLVGGRPDDRNK